ncbi:MAG TPA: hypothetical protein VE862_10485 [Candidatus Acidoferrum sp.]|nr:hypothetical protein [Candidatus Acidoferrum sp.]
MSSLLIAFNVESVVQFTLISVTIDKSISYGLIEENSTTKIISISPLET